MTDKNINQYDNVVLLKDYPEYGFIKGDTGAVVEILEPSSDKPDIGFGYLVEIMRNENTIGVKFLKIDDIDKI